MTPCSLAGFSYMDMVDEIHGSESSQTSNQNVPFAEPAVEVGAGGAALVDIEIDENADIVADVAVVVGIDVVRNEVAADVEAVAGFEAIAGFVDVADVDVVSAVKVNVGIELVAVDSCGVGCIDAD